MYPSESPARYTVAQYHVRQRLSGAAPRESCEMPDQYSDLHGASPDPLGKRAVENPSVQICLSRFDPDHQPVNILLRAVYLI